ncbi:MAG TPA: C40 family peptidase [Gemmatimonadaceae bacterium]|jgi:hypothetical protein
MKQLKISSHRALLVASALMLFFPQRPLTAQGPGLFDFFFARKDSPTDPLFAGLSLTGYSGVWGFRVGGALNFNNGDNGSSQNDPYNYRCDRSQCRYYGGQSYDYGYGLPIGVSGWSVDADLILAPFRNLPVGKSILLGFSPYAFVGIGGVGVSPNNAPDTSQATWSYGVGVHHDVLGWLGLSAEARSRRSLHSDSVIAIGSTRNWEFRAGLSISFGGHHEESVATTATGVIMPIESAELDHFETAESAARITARVLDRAEGLVETPYLLGGTDPNTGFDAAGFVQYVFAQEGVSLPRTAHAMAELGDEISTQAGSLRPGDLLFFGNDGTNIDHVAIFAGHDRIIHSTASGGGVRYDVLDEGRRGEWFSNHLIIARRIVAEGKARPRVRQDDSRGEGELDPPDQAPRSNRSSEE